MLQVQAGRAVWWPRPALLTRAVRDMPAGGPVLQGVPEVAHSFSSLASFTPGRERGAWSGAFSLG